VQGITGEDARFFVDKKRLNLSLVYGTRPVLLCLGLVSFIKKKKLASSRLSIAFENGLVQWIIND